MGMNHLKIANDRLFWDGTSNENILTVAWNYKENSGNKQQKLINILDTWMNEIYVCNTRNVNTCHSYYIILKMRGNILHEKHKEYKLLKNGHKSGNFKLKYEEK